MVFGIVLVILIALLAVAILVALIGYLYQLAKRSKATKTTADQKTTNPGIASSTIDKDAAAPANPPQPPSSTPK